MNCKNKGENVKCETLLDGRVWGEVMAIIWRVFTAIPHYDNNNFIESKCDTQVQVVCILQELTSIKLYTLEKNIL